MNHAPGSTLSPFATGLVPAVFDDPFPRTEDDANGNRDSSGYTVGTGGTLTASPNATYTYDAAGHLTARTDTSTGKVTTFAYDHRDRLTGITRKTSGGTLDYRTTYVYDALNRRLAEQVDADGAGAGSPVTTWTVFDGVNPYADFNGAGSLTERYLHGAAVDALLAMSDASGVTDWYLTDRLGSVRDVVDTSGTVLYHAGIRQFREQSLHDRLRRRPLRLHRPRTRRGAESLLLPRTLLRPGHRPLREQGSARLRRGRCESVPVRGEWADECD